MNLQLTVAICFVVIAITINLVVIIVGNRRQKKIFQKFADRYNLSFTISNFFLKQYPLITGDFNGFSLKIEEESKGLTQNDKSRYTIAKIQADTPLTFAISKEDLFKKIGKIFTGEQIQIGNEEIDRKLFFQSSQPTLFKSILDYEIEAKLKEASFRGRIICENGEIKCIQFKTIKSESKMKDLEELLLICVLFANKLKKI